MTTKSKTWKISRNLKKKLEASLENLSAKDATRLFIVYVQEADKKGIPLQSYDPVNELVDALARRLQKARGKSDQQKVVDNVNGFVLLKTVWAILSDDLRDRIEKLRLHLILSASTIERTIQEDATSTAVRRIRRQILEGTPRPVSRTEYDRLLAYLRSDNLLDLDSVAELAEEHLSSQLFLEGKLTPISWPWEVMDEFRGEATTEESRRAWAEEQGDAALDVFEGDKKWLEAWIKAGEYEEGYGHEASKLEIITRIQELVDAGELVERKGILFFDTYWESVGEYAVTPHGGYIIVDDGAVPAWVALRAGWESYLSAQGWYIGSPVPTRSTPDDAHPIINIASGEEADAQTLRGIARAYYQAFAGLGQKAKWGIDLADVDTIDGEQLVALLCQKANPFLFVNAPDLGRVNWDTFADMGNKSKRPKTWTPGKDTIAEWGIERVFTVADLNAHAKQLDVEPDVFNLDYMVVDSYYPVPNETIMRDRLREIVAMIDDLDERRQAFTYKHRPDTEEGARLTDVYPVEMATVLEMHLASFQNSLNLLATYDATIQEASDRYFDGMQFLTVDVVEMFDNAKGIADAGRSLIDHWFDRLEGYPWHIELSDLRLHDAQADTETAKAIVDRAVDFARRIEHIDEPEERLFAER